MVSISQSEIDSAARFGETTSAEEQFTDESNSFTTLKSTFADNLERARDARRVVITDASDADGLTCGTLYKHKWGDRVVILPAAHSDWAPSPISAFVMVSNAVPEDVSIYISDLGQNTDAHENWVHAITSTADSNDVYFRDHHQTGTEFVNNVDSLRNVEYAHDTSVCASKIVLEEDYPSAPDYLKHLVDLTDARDRYLDDTDRFDEGEIVTNAAYWLGFYEFIDVASEHGADFQNDPSVSEMVETRTEVRNRKIEWALQTTTTHDVAGYTVSLCYGDCYQSKVGSELLTQGADLAGIIKPSGKVSWRASEETPIAATAAKAFDGGGHDCAAGCTPFNTIEVDENTPKEGLAAQEREEILETLKEALSDD